MKTNLDRGQGFAGGGDPQANQHTSHFGHGAGGDSEESVELGPLDKSCPAFPVQSDVIHTHDPGRTLATGDLPYTVPADGSGSTSFEVIGDSTHAGYREPLLSKCEWEEFAKNPGYKIELPADNSELRHNPSSSEKQRKFMGAELARKRAGKKTRTGMSEAQLADYASKD